MATDTITLPEGFVLDEQQGLPEGFVLDTPPLPIRPFEDDIFTGERQISEFAPIPIQGIFLDDEELEARTSSALYYHRTQGIPRETAFNLVNQLNFQYLGRKEPAKTAWERTKQGYRNSKISVQTGDLGMEVINDILTGRDPQAMETKLSELSKLEGRITPDWLKELRSLSERMAVASAEQAPILAEGIKAAPVPALSVGILYALGAVVAGQAGPQALTFEEAGTVPAAFAKGVATGAGLGAAGRIGQLEAGFQMISFMQMRDEFGNKIDPKIAVVASLGVGAINGGIELLQWTTALSTFGIGPKVFENAAAAITKKFLANGTLNQIVAKNILKFGGTFTAEISQEIWQEINGVLGDELAKDLNNRMKGTKFPPVTKEAIVERLVETGKESALAFPALLLPGTIITTTAQVLEKKPVSEFEAARAELAAKKAPVTPAEAPKAAEPTITPPEAVGAVTEGKVEALKKATGFFPETVNKKLREGKTLTAVEEKATSEIEQAIVDLPVHEGTVKRKAFIEPEDAAAQYKVGEIVTEKGLVSASKSGGEERIGGNVVFEIESITGKDLGQFSTEGEVLFPRNTQFEVTKFDDTDPDNIQINLKEITQPPTPKAKPAKKKPKKPPAKEEPKAPRLATRAQEDALKAHLKVELEDVDTGKMSMAEQARLISNALIEEPEAVKAWAMGTEDPPRGIRPATAFEAVKFKAIEEQDVGTLYDLTNISTVPQRLKEFGQEIKAADFRRDSNDPVKAGEDVNTAREKSFEKKSKTTVKKAKKAGAKVVKAEIRKQADIKQLRQFIQDIWC